jgi:hypothetical protein
MGNCGKCIKKDVCKLIDNFKKTKELLEETLLNNQNEEVLKAVNMKISCNHYENPCETTLIRAAEEKHIPSLF